jgi:hypothetical protein
MEYDQRVIIRVPSKECVSPEDIHARLEAQLEDTSDSEYSERSVRRWCQYARQGREDLHDKVRPDRLPITFLNIRILVWLNEQPFHSAYSIVEALCVSSSTILSHLWELLRMINFHVRWIPHEFTTSLGQIRMEPCRELLPILKVHKQRKFQRFVTGTRVGSFRNFIILRNGAYREMMFLKR